MANGITEPNYMSRSEMLTKLSSGIPQTRQELEDLTKYIHEVDLDDHSQSFDFIADHHGGSGENREPPRTESSGLQFFLMLEISLRLFGRLCWNERMWILIRYGC